MSAHIPDHLFDPHYSTGWSGCSCGTQGWISELQCGHEVWTHGKGKTGAYVSCPSCQTQRKTRRTFPRPDVGRSPVEESLEKLRGKSAKRVVRASHGGYSSSSVQRTPPVSRVRKQRARSTKEGTMARRAAVAEPEPEVDTPDYTTYADKEPTPTMEWFADWLIEEVYEGTLPKGFDEDVFREGVRLGGTLRMEFQRSDMNKTRREELREQRATEAAEAKSQRASRKAAAAEPEDDEDDDEDEAPARPTRRAAKGSTAKASTSKASARAAKEAPAKAGAAKATTGSRRRGRAVPATAKAEAPF